MITEEIKLRDIELRKRYQDIIRSGVNCRYVDRDMVVRILASQPAPRFYMTPKTAEQHVLRYYRGKSLARKLLTRELEKDLAENYERIKAEKPHAYQYEIWSELVESPAKSFYLSKESIKDIIYGYTRPTSSVICHNRR